MICIEWSAETEEVAKANLRHFVETLLEDIQLMKKEGKTEEEIDQLMQSDHLQTPKRIDGATRCGLLSVGYRSKLVRRGRQHKQGLQGATTEKMAQLAVHFH